MFLWVENGEKCNLNQNITTSQTSQAINSKKTCEHYLLHQTAIKFVLGNKASATLI